MIEDTHESKVMKMKITCLPRMGLVVAAAILLHLNAHAVPINLGTAADFAILGGTAVTFAPPTTTVNGGSVGVWPGTSITGAGVGENLTLTGGTIHNNDAVAQQAQSDLTAAYIAAAGAPVTATLPNLITTQTLTTGVYNFTTPTDPTILDVDQVLTLSGPGLFVFQVGADLQTAIGSRVRFDEGAIPCNVIWQVTSSANLLGANFAGNILALTSITLGDGVTVDGRLLARNGNVTLIHDTINCEGCGQPGANLPIDNPDNPTHFVPPGQSVPDAGSTLLLLGSALATLSAFRRRFFSPA